MFTKEHGYFFKQLFPWKGFKIKMETPQLNTIAGYRLRILRYLPHETNLLSTTFLRRFICAHK